MTQGIWATGRRGIVAAVLLLPLTAAAVEGNAGALAQAEREALRAEAGVRQAQAEAERAEREALRAERNAMRAELESARSELNAAARRLAQAQRHLAESEHERARMHARDGDGRRRIEIIVDDELHRAGGTTPRLGILVSGRHNDNEVLGLTPGGGAEAAGIERGDRILAVNGRTLDEHTSISEVLADVDPGQPVKVRIARGDETLTLAVEPSLPGRDIEFFTRRFGPDRDVDIDVDLSGLEEGLAEMEREFVLMHERLGEEGPGAGIGRLPGLFALGQGADLVGNHDGLAPYFGTGTGVLVLRIDDGNPLGLQPGDVILAIDGSPVERPVDLARAMLDRQAGAAVDIAVMRQRQRLVLEGEVPASPLPGARQRRG